MNTFSNSVQPLSIQLPNQEEDNEIIRSFLLQLCELSSRLEELEEDQKGSEGYRARLKRENHKLKQR